MSSRLLKVERRTDKLWRNARQSLLTIGDMSHNWKPAETCLDGKTVRIPPSWPHCHTSTYHDVLYPTECTPSFLRPESKMWEQESRLSDSAQNMRCYLIGKCFHEILSPQEVSRNSRTGRQILFLMKTTPTDSEKIWFILWHPTKWAYYSVRGRQSSVLL